MEVVLGYLVETLGWNAAATRHILQERPNLLRPLGTPEGQQQHRVK